MKHLLFAVLFVWAATMVAGAQIPTAKIKDEDNAAARALRNQNLLSRADVDPRPISKLWEYVTAGPTRLPVAVAGQSAYVAVAGGRVAALSLTDGNLLWETPLGGECTAGPGFGPTEVYAATTRSAEEGKEGVVRALDRSTGLTRWTTVLPSFAVTKPTESGEIVVIGLENGTVCGLRRMDGILQWTFNGEKVTPGSVTCVGETAYLGGENGGLLAIKTANGEKLWQVQAQGKLGRPGLDETSVYVGSSNGYFFAFDQKSSKLKWKRRTGAAITAAPLVEDEQVLVASYDNFLYALNSRDGSLNWRQQLDGRLLFAPVRWGTEALAIAAFDSNEVTLIEPVKGNVTARLLFGENRIWSPLVVTQDVLLVPGDGGTVAARPLALQTDDTAIEKAKKKKEKKKSSQITD
ncbi:MAG: PQQ-binding-like beta-propeller repeat protein [Blastocatellia bacterium]|nr:PQQ-binding-like beta-propeller repeat protein [Blastocatellia bacterium]